HRGRPVQTGRAETGFAPAKDRMLEAIDHVCLVVSDLDRMADFYSRLLDMKVTKRVKISGDWIDRTVGLEGVVADVIYLEPPAGPRVELIRYQKPVAPRP